jgi:hypothetical protein
MREILYPATLALIFALGTAGCEREGPMEETGEEIDEAAEEARDRAD